MYEIERGRGKLSDTFVRLIVAVVLLSNGVKSVPLISVSLQIERKMNNFIQWVGIILY